MKRLAISTAVAAALVVPAIIDAQPVEALSNCTSVTQRGNPGFTYAWCRSWSGSKDWVQGVVRCYDRGHSNYYHRFGQRRYNAGSPYSLVYCYTNDFAVSGGFLTGG